MCPFAFLNTDGWNYTEFGQIRTMQDKKGETMFCAKDVCDALGYKQTHKAVDRHVDEGDGMKRPTPTTSGIQMMLYVNESGLYALILGSKLEGANRFKYWVTSEVLPSIRKQGGYMLTHAHESADGCSPCQRSKATFDLNLRRAKSSRLKSLIFVWMD